MSFIKDTFSCALLCSVAYQHILHKGYFLQCFTVSSCIFTRHSQRILLTVFYCFQMHFHTSFTKDTFNSILLFPAAYSHVKDTYYSILLCSSAYPHVIHKGYLLQYFTVSSCISTCQGYLLQYFAVFSCISTCHSQRILITVFYCVQLHIHMSFIEHVDLRQILMSLLVFHKYFCHHLT